MPENHNYGLTLHLVYVQQGHLAHIASSESMTNIDQQNTS